jgi:hypothetical protein
MSSVIGWNSAAEPRRIEVSLVRQLQPTAPPRSPTVPAAPPRAPRAVHSVHAARASSAPERAASRPDAASTPSSRDALVAQALALAASVAEPPPGARAPSASDGAALVAPVAHAAASASSSGAVADAVAGPPRPAFEWPPSTRLTYTLTGERGGGKLYGSAAVNWRREGAHYQVQFDIHITPFIDQHMLSDGEITADGLQPRHYDETFKVSLMDPRFRKIEFGDDEVTLNNGIRVVKMAQTQDGASQFVQFVWMFSTHPEWLKPGNIVQIPLALPGNLRRWNYQVVAAEPLALAFGNVDTVHLKPILDGPRRANEYPFEIWTAPTLQYLPVQILVKVDDRTFALLSLDDLPMQADSAPATPHLVPPPALPTPPPFGER